MIDTYFYIVFMNSTLFSQYNCKAVQLYSLVLINECFHLQVQVRNFIDHLVFSEIMSLFLKIQRNQNKYCFIFVPIAKYIVLYFWFILKLAYIVYTPVGRNLLFKESVSNSGLIKGNDNEYETWMCTVHK